MSIHQCPKCELRFTWKTELDDHCANDHPQFKHEYPVRRPAAASRQPPGDDGTGASGPAASDIQRP